MTFFDESGRAGSLTARVDHQDAVGVLIALELLIGEPVAGIMSADVEGTVIHCEGGDDLEVVEATARCLISVKHRPMTPSAIAAEFMRLRGRRYDDASREQSVAVALVGGQPSETVSLADKFVKLQSLLEQRTGAEAQAVIDGFVMTNNHFQAVPVEECFVLPHYSALHTRQFEATVAHRLRRAAPFTDYTDYRIAQAASDLVTRFAQARHARGSVTLREMRDSLYRAALPMELHMDPTSYVRTTYGYVRHPVIEDKLAAELRDLQAAARFAMKRYRRAWKIHPFAVLVKWPPPVKCIACNHPLVANFGGYTRRGIACPDCGFSPFMTLFYACSCGRPIPLVTQPSMDPVEVVAEIKSGMDTHCEHCGQRPKYERLLVRTFGLGIPWPPEEVSEAKLIDDREALGWSSSIREKKTAMEALLTDALRESLGSRLGTEASHDGSSQSPRPGQRGK